MASLPAPPGLVGSWRLDRVIDDRYAGERSVVHGLLELIAAGPDQVSWRETGVWTRPAAEVEVRRSLDVRSEPDGWWVLFEDGRPFHPWRPGSEVLHPCGADTYRGLVTGTSQRWTIRWDVEGPAKDYTMTSVLTPGP